jgi:hypothetical protein
LRSGTVLHVQPNYKLNIYQKPLVELKAQLNAATLLKYAANITETVEKAVQHLKQKPKDNPRSSTQRLPLQLVPIRFTPNNGAWSTMV